MRARLITSRILFAATIAFALSPPAQALTQAGAADNVMVPDRSLAVQLIRTTLGSINDANLTANYTVLHGLGSAEFQTVYSVERLSKIFEGLRKRNVDLSVVAQLVPVITATKVYDDQQAVQLIGHFTTRPVSIRFRLSYKNNRTRWQLHGFDLDFEPASGVLGAR